MTDDATPPAAVTRQGTATRRVARRPRRRRLLVALGLLAVALLVAWLVPVPTPLQMREWAQAIGAVAPLLFVVGQIVVTVAPVPRTVFTLASGLLFGAAVGVAVSLTATTLAAVLAFVVVRAVGRDLVAPHLDRAALRAVDARLRSRGWLAVISLRLIPVVPFSVTNYCCAVSSIGWRHYVLGTATGIVPGTVAVVVLGDALTGQTSPALLVISGVCALIGVVGLVVDARTPAARRADGASDATT